MGFGTGNYSVKVEEQLTTEGSTTYGTVFGIPLNGIGIVFTQQYISADIKVETENKPLSLGGTASFIGLYYAF